MGVRNVLTVTGAEGLPHDPEAPPIVAAGTIPWRHHEGRLEVALVHRPKYGDWSWPKGKLDPDELLPVAAVRETLEETGLEVHLGTPLRPTAYTVLTKEQSVATKYVYYWAARVVGGTGALVNEIDELAWLDPQEAWQRLDYARDREQLQDVVRADLAGVLDTWPLVVVRHAKAIPRSGWKGDDRLRPLDAAGIRQADAMIPVLAAFGVDKLVSSTSTRCVETLRPYAEHRHLPLRRLAGLSEEGFAVDKTGAPKHLRRLVERGRATALCTHGPLLHDILAFLAGYADKAESAHETLVEAADLGMSKGELLVNHVSTAGRIVAVERGAPRPASTPA